MTSNTHSFCSLIQLRSPLRLSSAFRRRDGGQLNAPRAHAPHLGRDGRGQLRLHWLACSPTRQPLVAQRQGGQQGQREGRSRGCTLHLPEMSACASGPDCHRLWSPLLRRVSILTSIPSFMRLIIHLRCITNALATRKVCPVCWVTATTQELRKIHPSYVV
jgi:hypothetical protein